jgi:diguanylate cyclase (GGDEF)-like protein
MEQFETNPEIISHYDLLKQLGVLDHINELNIEIKHLKGLFEEAWEIMSKTSIDDIMDFIVQQIVANFVPSYFSVILRNRSGVKTPKIMCYKNLKPIDSPVKIDTLEPFKNFFIKYPNPVSFPLLEYKMNRPEVTNSLLPFNPEIIIPVLGFWGLHGLIIIGRKFSDEDYTSEEITYLGRFMKFASVGIQNNIHHKSSITDVKTGLFNHSFFSERLEEELARVRRHHAQFTLFMADIDHFKQINDTHGHLVGDEVLRTISNIISALTRREDVASRFGGEEFAIMLTQVTKETAWKIAERIRQTIEQANISSDSKSIKVTISLGIRHVCPYTCAPSETIIRQADEALYNAKRHGRNRTTMFNPGLLFKALCLNGAA